MILSVDEINDFLNMLTVLSNVLITHDMYDMDYIFDGGDCGLMTPLSGALGGGRLRDDKGSQERLAGFDLL